MNPLFYEILKAHAPVLFEDKADMVVNCDWQTDERDSITGTIRTMWCVTHDTDHKGEDIEEPEALELEADDGR